MKTLIIYFSQTGYTRQAAERIRDGMVSENSQCDLTSLTEVDLGRLANYDLVGLGCPVFYYQEPFNVRDFINDLPELKSQQWFVFCTHASVMGVTLNSMAEHLQKKGALVIGYFDMYADATAPFIPYPTFTTGHPDSQDLDRATAFGREIDGRSRRIAAGEQGLMPEPEPVGEEWVRGASMFTRELVSQITPKFTINLEECTKCLACEENCPVSGIDVAADPPRIQDPCIGCFYCVEVCPTLAINADWEMLVSMNPAHYARLRIELDRAAARGEFRWLIDPDSLDFDNYLYKQWEHQRKGK